jgi:hypothetical protein
MGSLTTAQRQALCELLHDVDARKVAAQQAVLAWRNFTLSFSGALLVILPLFAFVMPKLGVGLATIRGPGANPNSAETLTASDIGAIEMWGALGGVVGIIAALGQMRLTQRPSSLQIAQLVLKPLAGGAVALFAVVLLQAGLVQQVHAVASGTIAAYAVLFGFAQQALTRSIDRRASTVLAAATPTRQVEHAP